jgi:4,5-DOPA dioxygenase extradiol
MERKSFLKALAFLPLTAATMKLNEFDLLASDLPVTDRMPALFLGHGSPMNAIEENEFVDGFRKLASNLPIPRAILCISAHWETRGTWVTAMQHPRTIHDFGGFPQALFEVQYPAPGSPDLANETRALITSTSVGLDDQWGLDHGAWSVIKHLYPQANIPVIQLSIDHFQSPEYHYQLGKQLSALRKKGILIIGSGNMVHNLGKIAWDKLNTDNYGYDWALEASSKMKQWIQEDHHQPLIAFRSQGKAFDLAIPTPEHFLPLLYTLGMQEKGEAISLFNDKAVAGSLTMTSVKIGY